MGQVYIHKLKNGDVNGAVAEGLPAVLGQADLRKVRRALIKPNLVNHSPAHTGVTTDLRIVAGLIKLLRENGVPEIYVGENSLDDTETVFKALDVYSLEKLGAKVVNFKEDNWVRVESPLGIALKKFYLPETVINCDLFISAAKMKTHEQTHVTLSIKNVLGTISAGDRKIAHKLDIHGAILDVFSYIAANRKFLSVVDAIYALEGKLGPISGNPLLLDLLVFGNDPVATDAVCVDIMGYDVNLVEHILMANKLGYGGLTPGVLRGEAIPAVRRKFEMPVFGPSAKTYIASLINDKFFKRSPFLQQPQKCTLCKTCLEHCPIEAIAVKDRRINIDTDKCISCLVCCEACMQGALNYRIKNYAVYKLIKGVKDYL